jgi:hypothetical protein
VLSIATPFMAHHVRNSSRHIVSDMLYSEDVNIRLVLAWERQREWRMTGARAEMDAAELYAFGTRYAAAWSSQDPWSVAAFFSESGSLSVNDGAPAVGRAAIADVARRFMTAFPDMIVTMDEMALRPDATVFHWTLAGTNTGPGGTGHRVRIGGYEEWTFDPDRLVAESKGHFDAEEYARQLAHGVDE